jgi:hypothetical protein
VVAGIVAIAVEAEAATVAGNRFIRI